MPNKSLQEILSLTKLSSNLEHLKTLWFSKQEIKCSLFHKLIWHWIPLCWSILQAWCFKGQSWGPLNKWSIYTVMKWGPGGGPRPGRQAPCPSPHLILPNDEPCSLHVTVISVQRLNMYMWSLYTASFRSIHCHAYWILEAPQQPHTESHKTAMAYWTPTVSGGTLNISTTETRLLSTASKRANWAWRLPQVSKKAEDGDSNPT